MSSWDRPPAGTTAVDFFEKWLPAAFAAANRQAPSSTSPPLVRASLSGAGGGAWDVQALDDELRIDKAGREPPDVWLRQSTADFLTALSPEPDPDLPQMLPPGWSALEDRKSVV